MGMRAKVSLLKKLDATIFFGYEVNWNRNQIGPFI